MKRTAQIALAALLLMAAACHRTDSKDAQLKALDEAYQSGVFTKQEYDAKKQALMGTPAAPAATSAPAPVPAAEPAAPAPAPVADATPPTATPPPIDTAPPQPAPVRAAPPRAAPPARSAPAYTPPPVSQPQPEVPVAPPQASAPPMQAQPPAPAPAPAPPAAEPEPAPLIGCQDAESRAGGPNGTQQRFFIASEDAVRRAAIQAFANLDFVVHNSTAHEMEASKKGRLNTVVGAGTERVILHFSNGHQNGQAGTRLTAETKRGFMGRVTQKSWTTAVLAQISCNLRAGR